MAHGAFGKILAVWDAGSGAQLQTASAPGSGATRRVTTGRPIGLRTQSPTGALTKAWKLTVRLFSEWDQVVFVVLFLVFVKFAFDVLLSLY